MKSTRPPVQLWVPVGSVTIGTGAAGVFTSNVSDAVSPLVLVAVTNTLNPTELLGAIPVNVSVAALKCSQDGRAAPLDSVAL